MEPDAMKFLRKDQPSHCVNSRARHHQRGEDGAGAEDSEADPPSAPGR